MLDLRSVAKATVLAGAIGAAWTAQANAQVPADTLPAPADSAVSRVSPAGAFLRGALVPGWGHTVSGSLTRGAFYFGVETSAAWMTFKTMRRLRAARERLGFREDRVTSRLRAQGVVDPDEIAMALDEDEDIARARGLVAAREEQREDWLAVAVFFLLVSGVDAFVSAHLQDFPQPLTIEADAGGERLGLVVRIPVTGRP